MGFRLHGRFARFSATLVVALGIVSLARAAESGLLGAAGPYSSVLAQVKGQTRVAILVPSSLPAPLKDSDIHFANGHGDASGYQISLFYDQGIGNLVGSFAGRANQTVDAFGEKLALERGAVGYFKARVCGVSCAPSQIDWWLDGIHYTAQLRLDIRNTGLERDTMIAVANSAITGGPR